MGDGDWALPRTHIACRGVRVSVSCNSTRAGMLCSCMDKAPHGLGRVVACGVMQLSVGKMWSWALSLS